MRAIRASENRLLDHWAKLADIKTNSFLTLYGENGLVVWQMFYLGVVGACIVGYNPSYHFPDQKGEPMLYVNLKLISAIEVYDRKMHA